MLWNSEMIQKSILFAAGMWGACLTYLLPLRRKEQFSLKVSVTAVTMIVVLLILHNTMALFFPGAVWAEIVLLVASYVCDVFVFRVCVKVHGFEMWYCGAWSLITCLLFMQAGNVIQNLIGLSIGKNGAAVVQVMLFLAGYVLVGATAARWMPEKQHYRIGPRQMLSAWILCAMSATIYLFAGNVSGMAVLGLMLQFYCVTILYLQNALFKKSSMRKELDILSLLWHQQKEQYRISRETIDLINHKCHDLKHQVQAIRVIQDEEEREKHLREIEDSVQIYNAIVRTGNEILDTLLTEKSLMCEKNKIHINCVADGELLSFMDPVDLYTLFGNGLDNAIEAVSQIGQEEGRVIDIMIYERQKFIVIQIVNPVRNEVEFEDGLPLTTKARNGYHGFGMKSMRHMIEKYDGYLSAEVKDQCFYLKMILPRNEERLSRETG